MARSSANPRKSSWATRVVHELSTFTPFDDVGQLEGAGAGVGYCRVRPSACGRQWPFACLRQALGRAARRAGARRACAEAPLILNACAWRAKGAVSQSRPERPCRPCALTRARLYVCAGQVSPQRSAKMDTSDLQGVALKAFSFGKQLVKQGCVAPRGSMRACLACGRLPCAGLAHGRWEAGSATGRAGVSAMPPALCESACVCVCVCACVCTRVRTIQAKLGVKHDGDRDQGDGRDRQRGMGPFRDTAPRNLDGYHRPRPASTDLPGAALMQRARARRGSSRALCARRIGTRLSTEGSPCPRLSERSFAPCSSRVELISGAHVRRASSPSSDPSDPSIPSDPAIPSDPSILSIKSHNGLVGV